MNAEEKEAEEESGRGRASGSLSFGEKGRTGQSEVSNGHRAKTDSQQRKQRKMEEVQARARARKGFIYLVQSSDGYSVKIGFSARVLERFSSLKGEYPGIKLLGAIRGTMALEWELHRKFEKDLVMGNEWFRKSRDINSFIKSCDFLDRETIKGPPRREDETAVLIALGNGLLEEISDYRFAHRCRTRADAIRKLIEFGLKKDKGGSK